MDTTSLIGKKVGRLTVVEYSHSMLSGGGKTCRSTRQYYWKCVCDCGNVTFVNRTSLRSGRSRSCGCLRNEITTASIEERRRKYGSYFAKTK